MKKISLLSLILSAGCMDWITVIPDDFVVAEAGPASVDTGSRSVDTGSRCGRDEDNDNHVNCLDDGTVIDCRDDDPNINPSADERCNDEIDNNCNDLIDEGCQAPEDAGPAPMDSGNARQDEICGDGVDNDGDGSVDEGPCVRGPYQRNAPCYEGAYRDAMTVCMRFNGQYTNAVREGDVHRDEEEQKRVRNGFR